MKKFLNDGERCIETQLNRGARTIANVRHAFSEKERALVKSRLAQHGMLIYDYVLRLETIIQIASVALMETNDKKFALLGIVRRSPDNCKHCLFEGMTESAENCDLHDYDCCVCDAECACKGCLNGSRFCWNGEYRVLQKPLELYPGVEIEGISSDGTIPVYIEDRYGGKIGTAIYDQKRDQLFFGGGDGWRDNERQGRTWRPWRSIPTEEERKAAPPWEFYTEGFTEEELHEKA